VVLVSIVVRQIQKMGKFDTPDASGGSCDTATGRRAWERNSYIR